MSHERLSQACIRSGAMPIIKTPQQRVATKQMPVLRKAKTVLNPKPLKP